MNVARLLEGHDPDSIALISRNEQTTYGQLLDKIARLRGGLAANGIRAGDRVAIACGNNRYFVKSYFAIVGMGAIAVPVNPASPGAELQRQLAEVGASAIIVGPNAASSWKAVDVARLEDLRLVIRAETTPAEGELALSDVEDADPIDVVDVSDDTIAALLFTSGTAGLPRAAMLTHGNLTANIEQQMSGGEHAEADDVVYGVLPLFHIFGLNVMLTMTLSAGATLVLVQRFDPATAVQSIVQRGVTIVPGAPPMWVAFTHFDALPDDAFRSVRIAASGASRLPPAIAEAFEARFGVPISEGYGLTEASPTVTTSRAGNRRIGSVGRLVAGQEMRIVGDHGEDVAVGDAGEIWVKGPNIFAGYWNDQEATDRVLQDGWLRTGDIGLVDEDGFLYLVDRAKDLIIVSGFNVFPAEVEAVLNEHPGVVEAGVLGVPHPHHGEAVKAYVVAKDGGDLDEESLIDYAAEYLARYKCPSKVIFVDELPRNAAGKLIRRDLEGTVLA